MTWSFLERESQSYDMSLRLFVEGVEVTDWLQDDVSVSLVGSGGENSLSFTLANPDDIWMITPENINGQWRKTNNLYSELPKKQIYERKKARDDEARATMAKYKVHDSLRDTALYGLGPHTAIFHKHDCVRLFVRHPLVHDDWWMVAFTGFVNQHPFTEDYVTGARPVSLTCYCLKGLLRKMRVQENPMPASDAKGGKEAQSVLSGTLKKDAIIGPEAGPFEDLLTFGSSKGLNHTLVGKNFEQCIALLLLGEGALNPSSKPNDKVEVSIFKGMLTQNISMPPEAQGLQPTKAPPSEAEKKVNTEFDKLNADPIVRAAGGIGPNGWLDQTQHDRFVASLEESSNIANSSKKRLADAERRAQTLTAIQNDAKQRKEQEQARRKTKGQKTEATANKTAVSPSAKSSMLRGHVGRLTRGKTYKYSSNDPAKLETWHNLCVFGNEGGFYLTYDQVTMLGKGTVLENVEGSPYNGYVHMLLPAKGTPAEGYAQSDYNYQHDMESEIAFSTRYDLIEHVCKNLEFQWWVTAWGDVVFEFPCFDFSPKGFGNWSTVFTLEKHAMNASMEDEATDVPTALVVTGQERNKQAGDTANSPPRSINPNRVVVYAPLLAARSGVIVEPINAPTALGGEITGGNAQQRLEAWGALQLAIKIGESSTMNIPMPYRPWITPNRPVEHVLRKRIGVTHQVTHSLSIGGVCSTTPQMKFVKKLANDGKYRYPTSGGEDMPINYATMFGGAGDVKKSGMVVRNGVYQGDSRGTEQTVTSRPRSKPPRPGQEVKLPEDWRWLKECEKRSSVKWAGTFPKPGPDIWVVHCGGGSGDIAKYLCGGSPGTPCKETGDGRPVSVHFIIEPNGRKIQMVPLDHGANNVGMGLNRRSLGHEFRGGSGKYYSNAEINALIELLCRCKTIYPSLKLLVGHVDLAPGSRSDPGPHFPWERFKGLGFDSPHFQKGGWPRGKVFVPPKPG